MCNKQCGLIAGAVVGGLLAVLGGILIPIGNSIIHGSIEKEAVIENGTVAYENWVQTGGAVYRQFWFFDVKNPFEIIEHGAKPVVVEKGPYTYRTRYQPKENITANSNNTISFLLPYGAIFEPSMSIGSEADNVTSLNLAVAGAFSLFPPWTHSMLNQLIKNTNSSLFQYRTVQEILWGYRDPLLQNKMTGLFVLDKCLIFVFFQYNGTFDGYYTVFTGKDDIRKTAMIDRWKGERHLSYWNDTYCDMVNGTDGSSFAPFIDKKKPLYFFSSDICRSVYAEFESSQNLKGITVYRYTLPPETFAAPAVNLDNRCYCTDRVATNNCTLGGILDISRCKDGIPIYISLPHFLHGSEILREAIIGINPHEDHHSTYLDVEPFTGFSMRFAKRLQINLKIGPSNKIEVLSKIKDNIFFPVVWLNETAALDDATAEEFKASLTSRMELLETVEMTLIGIGLVIFLACTISLCVLKNKKRGKEKK
ncbi:CD36 protein, partial [Atractosteus spatula]|nr:CD36 protein [Atractosteus spatula]